MTGIIGKGAKTPLGCFARENRITSRPEDAEGAESRFSAHDGVLLPTIDRPMHGNRLKTALESLREVWTINDNP